MTGYQPSSAEAEKAGLDNSLPSTTMISPPQNDPLLELEKRARLQTGPLVPLLPAKTPSRQLPSLPLRTSADAPFGAQQPAWQLDTFIVPAAFPRSAIGSTRHPTTAAEKPTDGGARVKVDANAVYKEMLEAQVPAHQHQVQVDDQQELAEQEQLYIAVNRYRPKARREGGPRGLTLVFAHANGFHKGVQPFYEPRHAPR